MSTVLGIDLSSKNIDLVWLDEDGPAARWERLPLGTAKTPAFERLRNVPGQLRRAIAREGENCYLAAIERPKTHSFVSAAACFPVFGAVVACLPPGLEVWDVAPAQWKQGLGLKGNASKEECAAAVRDLWLDDLKAGEIRTWSQDALDAWAVAYYARELNTRGVSLEQAREKQLVLT